nr:PREDICTED: histamine H1 receptor isoform X2 [Lepisosteus oculatus]
MVYGLLHFLHHVDRPRTSVMETTSVLSLIDNSFNGTWKKQSDAEERRLNNSSVTFHNHINDALLGLVLGTVSLLTVIMNILVLYAVKKERTLHTVGNLYIVSLSVADLIVGATVMPLSIVYLLEKEWRLGNMVCQFWLVMDYVASTASIFSLFILCVDRYRSVRQPLRYLKYRTRARASVMISGAWLLSMTWVIPILGWRTFSDVDPQPETENKCDTDFRFVTWFKVLTAVLNFYVPSVLMLWFYAQIYMAVRKHYRQREIIKESKPSSYNRNCFANNCKISGKRRKTDVVRQEESAPQESSHFEGLIDQYSLGQQYYPKDINEGIETWVEKNTTNCCYQAALFTIPKHQKQLQEDMFLTDKEKHPLASLGTQGDTNEQHLAMGPETPLKVACLPLGILQSENEDVNAMFVSVSDCNLIVPNSVAGVCEITDISDVQRFATVLCKDEFSHPEPPSWSHSSSPKVDTASVNNLKQSWQKFCSQSKQYVQSLRISKERKAAKQLGFIIAGFMATLDIGYTVYEANLLYFPITILYSLQNRQMF